MIRYALPTFFSFALVVLLYSCGAEKVNDGLPGGSTTEGAGGERNATVQAKRQRYRIVNTFAHDTSAFTQGLAIDNGQFIETTGLAGKSSIRRVDIPSGKVIRKVDYTYQFFGEGVCILNGKAYAVTWLNQTGFIFDASTLKQEATFTYMGEGWGLTTDGTSLYLSNGSNIITRRDPVDFHQLGVINVTLDGSPLRDINELEWVNGEIWANVWKTENIARIDPATGVVTGLVELAGIFPEEEKSANVDVMNGIAYDATTGAIYVTGKHWPWVYQIVVE